MEDGRLGSYVGTGRGNVDTLETWIVATIAVVVLVVVAVLLFIQ